MNDNIKLIAVAAGSFTMVGIAAHDCFKIVRREKARRAEIVKNKNLTLAALANAQVRMEKKLASGSYLPNVFDLINDLDEEVEFEMIALRYDQ